MKSKQGDLTYLIELEDGVIVRRHIDQMQARTAYQKQSSEEVSTSTTEPEYYDLTIDSNSDQPSEDSNGEQFTTNCIVQGSARNRSPPDRYGFSSTTESHSD